MVKEFLVLFTNNMICFGLGCGCGYGYRYRKIHILLKQLDKI